MKNQDKNTVEGFGDEWSRFDQSDLPEDEQQLLFDEYFSVFPWKDISIENIKMHHLLFFYTVLCLI